MDPREKASPGAPLGRARQPFSPTATCIYALLWLLLLASSWSEMQGGRPEEQLYYPVSSAARAASVDLAISEAIATRTGISRALLEQSHGAPEELLDAAIEVQRGLVDALDAQPSAKRARAQLALLLAEDGELDEAAEILERPPPLADFAHSLRVLYAEGAAPAPVAQPPSAAGEVLLEGWTAERFAQRLLMHEGDGAEAAAREALRRERANRVLCRHVALLAISAGLLLAGIAVLLAWAWQGGPHERGPAPGAPWSLSEGIAVLVRGEFFGQLFFASLPILEPLALPEWLADLLYGCGSLFAAGPLVWLVWRHLLRPYTSSAPDPLGLDPRALGARRIAAFALAAIAIDLLGSSALAWLSWEAGFEVHWSEGFDEILVWGSSLQALLASLDYVAFAPTVEELAFRGVLYFSLRKRMPPLPAAIASAAFFGLVHFYSVPGFLATSWSGVVWALVFERSRSLWPGAAAHATYNLLYVLGLLMLYR